MKKEFKKFMFNNSTNILVGIISLIILIIGSFIIGFVKSLLIVGFLDILWFIPPIIKRNLNKKKNRKRKTIA